MFRKPELVVHVTPCVACGQPSDSEVWGTPLCLEHWGQWLAEAPTAGMVEKAAQSVDVERAVVTVKFGTLVVLKPGVLERDFKAWTAAWVAKKRTGVAEAA